MKRDKVINRALSIFFTILSLAWIYPVFMIALNSFKKATAINSFKKATAISTTTAFDLLTPETFNGLANYMHALNDIDSRKEIEKMFHPFDGGMGTSFERIGDVPKFQNWL